MKKIVPFLFALFVLTGCSSVFERGPIAYDGYEESYSGGYAAESMPVMMDQSSKMMLSADSTSYDASVIDRKLIKTGDLSLHVESVNQATADISTVVTAKEGMVISSNITRGENSYSGYMNVRVPAAEFEITMALLKELAIYVDSENSNSSDVTEYYMDIEARLKNKQAEEAQYLEIMKQASTVTDTLAVTQALNDVRYEIESLQAQIKSYDTQIDYSNIYISLSEDESAAATSETWSPSSTLHGAQSDFVVFLQGAADLLIYAGIFGGPLLLLLLLVWIVRRSMNRKARK